MPMLYGEGDHKAFIRLQEEVMKRSDDQSLFLWKKKEQSYTTYLGLLAPSPREFVDTPDVVFAEDLSEDRPYASTNKGISIRLTLVPYEYEPDVYIASLNCKRPGLAGESRRLIGILLKRLEGIQFVRVDAHRIYEATPPQSTFSIVPTDLYVRQSIRLPISHLTPRVYGFALTEQINIQGVYLADTWPVESWNADENCFRILPKEQSKKVALRYRSRGSHEFSSHMCGTFVVLLQWDKKSMQFSAHCLRDPSWTETTSMKDIVEGFGVRGNIARTWFLASALRTQVKVDMGLGMWRDNVVIKVGVAIEWTDKLFGFEDSVLPAHV
ncbi:hypothetical protein PG985_015757 [Apiospora marii]